MKVNDEKIAQIMIVRFETSTSPNWYEIKKYIRVKTFRNTNI